MLRFESMTLYEIIILWCCIFQHLLLTSGVECSAGGLPMKTCTLGELMEYVSTYTCASQGLFHFCSSIESDCSR